MIIFIKHRNQKNILTILGKGWKKAKMAAVTKEDIIISALDLFSRKGYLKTSMNDIAEAVGLTKGGLYHHVDSKEDILVWIHNQMAEGFIEKEAEAMRPEADCKKKLQTWINIYVKLIRDYQPHLKVFFSEMENITDKSKFEDIIERRDTGFRLFHGLIKEGIEKKEFRTDIDPLLATMFIFGTLNWFYRWYKKDGDFSIEEITNAVEKFIFGGLLGKNPAKGPY